MSVNPANIRIVRDLILAHPDQFDMVDLVGEKDAEGFASPPVSALETHPCNTTACIAGWAAFAAGYRGSESVAIQMEATIFLGLPNWNTDDHVIAEGPAYDLFFPDPIYYEATPEQAAKVLDHLIETGEVDWSKAS